MGTIVADYRVGWLCKKRSQSELVTHCARENEKTSFFACTLCYISFEVIGGRVFLEDIIQ
jgi:hypothetical protein